MPPIAPVVEKLEDVAEPARQFYKSEGGKFVLDLTATPSGFVPAAELATANGRVIEFRDTNIALKKQVDELSPLKVAFEGIDPVAAKAALASQEELKKKGITKPDDLAAAIQTAVQAAVTPLTQQLTQITTTNAENQKRADLMTLNQVLGAKFSKAGGVPEAQDFISSKAAGVFVVEGGAVKAAPNQFSVDRPGEPLSVDEWMTRQTKEQAFAFKASSGGGANPAPGAGGGTQHKPGQLVLKDPTPQQLGEHAGDIKSGKMRVEYSS